MSGDSQRDDDPDFLEDDFVVEDLAGKNDDLEQLFDAPGIPGPATPPAPGAAPDSEDVLFTDHTLGVEASESFQGGEGFAENAASTWRGDGLELDDTRPAGSGEAEKLAAAEAAFTEELGSLLHTDEELELDSDKELELVDGPPASDGISEIEQSGPFVLDDGEGTWQEQTGVPEPTAAAEQPIVEPTVAEGIWEAVEEPAMAEHAADEAALEEPGWEPLPESNVDQLSEVGEVERAEGGEAPAAPEELADVDGHDIYSDEQAPVLVGPRAAAGRLFGVLTALAASLALVAGGAVVVMRPEWIGLQLEPQRVQQVQIERPRVEVAVATPAVVKVQPPQLGQVQPPDIGKPTGAEPVPTPETPKDPVATAPGNPTDPVATPPQPAPTDPVATAPQPAPGETVPFPVVPETAPAPSPVATWPLAAETKPQPTGEARKKGAPLVRISDNTMVGEVDATPLPKVQAVDGVLPGTRAFAQLHNGNYFIGSIKVADADRVTMRINEGEVTLPADEIARITALGSADYEALQKATSGFVRLTNNNKLVGGILSQIADDHIVLEFRSNRVMLPRSAVGEIVRGGEAEQEVRLDVTREEDDWVRSLAERQLGAVVEPPKRSTPAPSPTSESTPVVAPTPAPPAVTPKATPAPTPAPKAAPKAPSKASPAKVRKN